MPLIENREEYTISFNNLELEIQCKDIEKIRVLKLKPNTSKVKGGR